MAFVHGKNASVLVDEYDFSTYCRNLARSTEITVARTSTFQQASSRETYIPGHITSQASLSGLYEGDDNSVFHTFLQAVLATAGQLIAMAFHGWTIGNSVEVIKSDLTTLQHETPLDDMVTFAVDVQEKAWSGHGISLHDVDTAESSAGNDASVDNGASSANGGVGHLHVVTNSRDGAATIKIQHSTDDAVWADLITFTSTVASTVTKERVEVAGTVNRYLRGIRSSVGGSTGSINYGLAFARK